MPLSGPKKRISKGWTGTLDRPDLAPLLNIQEMISDKQTNHSQALFPSSSSKIKQDPWRTSFERRQTRRARPVPQPTKNNPRPPNRKRNQRGPEANYPKKFASLKGMWSQPIPNAFGPLKRKDDKQKQQEFNRPQRSSFVLWQQNEIDMKWNVCLSDLS